MPAKFGHGVVLPAPRGEHYLLALGTRAVSAVERTLDRVALGRGVTRGGDEDFEDMGIEHANSVV